MAELQRVPEWYIQRLGKFTGSEFFKLMTNGRTKDKFFGDVALGYIDAKVAEIITDGTCLDYTAFRSKQTDWGNDWEPEAKRRLSEKFNIVETGFIDISERFGCSPDGIITGLIENDIPLEIKCPFNTVNHIEFLTMKDGQDLKEISKQYYTQVQVEIMALKAPFAHFVSFDPRCSPLLQLKEIVIWRDEEMIKEIELRLAKAIEILNNKIQILFDLCKNS